VVQAGEEEARMLDIGQERPVFRRATWQPYFALIKNRVDWN